MWGVCKNGCQVKELNILCWDFNLKRNCFPVSSRLHLPRFAQGGGGEETGGKNGIAIKIKDGILMDGLVSERVRFVVTATFLKSLHVLVMRVV